jgi:type I restriction enzyme S subunit
VTAAKPYATYKPTSIPGLKQLPAHWSTVPICALYRQRKLTGFENEVLLSVYRDFGVVPKDSRDDNNNRPSDDLSVYQLVEPGDLVTNKMKTWQGSIAVSAYRGIVSPAYFVYQSQHKDNARYLHHLLRCGPYVAAYMAASKGVRVNQWDLDPDLFRRFPIVRPPLEEQAAIADFLDRETARIDALIEKKTRFIELLREKRQALVTEAVTRGLDPAASLKDSGVDWLGRVPAHWDVRPLKYIARVQTGVAKGKDNSDRETVTVPYLRVANVQDGFLDLEDVATIDIPIEDLARYRLQAGDVLMNEGGDFDKLGRGHVWGGEIDPCIHQNHVFAVRPLRVSSDWLNTFTGSTPAQFYFMGRSKQSTNLASISSSNLMELSVPIPPEHDQLSVLEQLHNRLEHLDALTRKTECSIDLLKERRAALITAAVTGQIDVRSAAPEEEAEPA